MDLSEIEPTVKFESLELLVQELLLQRTEGLEGLQLAAFIDGWSSLLDLVRRTDLIVPEARPDVADALALLVERVRAAQAAVLDDGTG